MSGDGANRSAQIYFRNREYGSNEIPNREEKSVGRVGIKIFFVGKFREPRRGLWHEVAEIKVKIVGGSDECSRVFLKDSGAGLRPLSAKP